MMRTEILLLGSMWLGLKACISAEGRGVPFKARDVCAW
jgi:hypothetical protein